METVGEYEYNTRDLIGHGAFAVVFKGRHKKTPNFVVAIKSITKKNLAKSHNLLGKEIKILKELTELHHDNVVALLDCKESQHHVYLVMEYCNGGDLADYLNVKGTLSEDTIRLFLRQLAGAMKALHAKGIVHRDLKPQNILLSHAGKPNPQPHEIRLKIADFGFARFLQDGVMAATLCGSPMYMAPEVIMSLQYDAKADLWSLGTIVFQCLTGKAPFQAQTPQALKQFYEKNANLAPKIPPGTSPELSDLLLGLLKRNARDRMEFDTFFSHPFLAKYPAKSPSVPVPVPAPGRQRSLSTEPSPGVAMVAPPSPTPGQLPSAAAANYPEEMKTSADALGAEAAVRRRSPSERYSLPKGSPTSARELGSASSPEDHEDFVLVPPNLPSDHSTSSNESGRRRVSEGYEVGSAGREMRVGTPGKGMPLASPPRPSYLPVTGPSPPSSSGSSYLSEPIPVPTQKQAYQQIQNSQSREGIPASANANCSPRPARRTRAASASSPLSSPRSPPKGSVPRSQPISMKRTLSTSDTYKNGPDISSLSPPAVQFMIGTPPSGGRRRSASGSSCGTPPPVTTWQVSPVSGRQTPTSSPLRRSGRITPPHFVFPGGPTGLPPILGSPNRPPSLMEFDNASSQSSDRCGNLPSLGQPPVIPFSGGRAMTLPEITGSQISDMSTDSNNFHRSSTEGQLNEQLRLKPAIGCSGMPAGAAAANHIVLHYGQTAPFLFPHQASAAAFQQRGGGVLFGDSSPESLPFGTSPPGMEGPIMFVAPELPEETLLEREHNETLAKLNFVVALVDCVMELAKQRGTPLAALTGSVARREVSSRGESSRRSEQLVLLIRALQLLSSALNLARVEIQACRLQPSTSVKNVVGILNERFRYCLSWCKQLHSTSQSKQTGVDSNNTNITADKLLYNYAIEMCQSAALDELFGNPQECFRRYQTAQILLHSLSQQVQNDQDRLLLAKYKEAVEKRLYVLQQQGYIYAYDTT